MKIAVGSGKGGTGKTFFSVNLYYALVMRGIESVLTDCDAEAPDSALFFDVTTTSEKTVTELVPVIDTDACTFCGRCYDYCNYGAVFYLPEAGIIHILDDLCHSCGACLVACNFHSIAEKPLETGMVTTYGNSSGVKIVEAKMRIGAMTPVPVIKAAVAIAALDGNHVILDAPPGTSCPFVHTVSKADYVILVTEPTPFGMSDLRHSVETVIKIGKPFGVVINKAGLGDLEVYEYLRQKSIPLLMEIPYEKDIAKLTSQGKKIAEFRPEWIERLAAMFSKIEKEYGNSNHQR